MPPKWNINGKSLTMPLAAFTMATLLFVYTRTSIQAAKRNAQRHREADGGQINWHNESLRRHGKLEGPGEGKTVVGELVGTLKGNGGLEGKGAGGGGKAGADGGETAEERRVRERRRGM